MIVIALFTWWYSSGWLALINRTGDRIGGVLDFFSAGDLLRTLFAPFRQISAQQVQGPIGEQFRAFLDRLFSRFVGAFLRSILIIAGLFGAFAVAVVGLVQVLLWPFIPLLPVIGLVLAAGGWLIS